VNYHVERDHDERSDTKRRRGPFEAAKTPGARRHDDDNAGQNHCRNFRHDKPVTVAGQLPGGNAMARFNAWFAVKVTSSHRIKYLVT